ncbi:MAG: hypothetical protein GOVbin2917_137 [Prokaryotic dsDNA virus sp.]|jgi:hypothetical protein|nr:MAG: hypothetical protein GOVbin2917_137 [Prokaryotic dsDNA virus sp.]|tara:strand:+ start:20023 stop:21147 length:1125 start_codon:yes stop_codon:yes gene_type:complete
MSYVLKDGTNSNQYREGDKFVYCGEKGDHEVFSEGEMLTLHWDDESRCPEFREDSTEETGYTYWSDLKAYKVDTEENDKSMKLEKMDYVDTKRFTLEELLILEGLLKEQGYFILEGVDYHYQTNYLHYGVDNNGHTMFYDLWYKNNGGKDVSEEFRNYLSSLDNKEEDKSEKKETTMKIEKGNYIETSRFTSEGLNRFLLLFEKQNGVSLKDSGSEEPSREWDYYGVDNEDGTLINWNVSSSFDSSGDGNIKDITEEFLNYLDTLSQESNESVEEDTTETDTTDNLSVKDRLLALADGKELEWYDVEWYPLESFQSDFGDILYDESIEVRVELVPEKSEVELLFEEYCSNNGYDPEQTDFTTFKAGYDAAKEND